MTIGVGLAGFGLAGSYLHAPLIEAAGMTIRAVATRQAEAVWQRLPKADVVPEPAALNLRDDIQLVVIATPNAFHFEQSRAALDAGKHVVVDKPVTPGAADALALHAHARDRGLKLAVYQNRRWDSDFLTLKLLLQTGAVGRPARFVNRWARHRATPQPDRWRETPGPGAGLLYDLGPHMIDQALVLFGPPDWIEADIFRQRGPAEGPDDGFELWMGKGCLRIQIGASSLSAGPPRELRLDGDAASFVKTGFDPQENQLRAGMSPLAPGFGVDPTDDCGALIAPDGATRRVRSQTGRWIDFYAGMRAAIESDAPVPVSAADAAETIALIEAAFESSRTGRRVAFR
jgi:scyllo-inositol 2-dehydrogenase (NADP+)